MPPAAVAAQTRVNRVYDDLSRGGVVTYEKVRDCMIGVGLEVPQKELETMLRVKENMGVIDGEEWENFARGYPAIIDSLYYRIGDKWSTREQEKLQQSVQKQIQVSTAELEEKCRLEEDIRCIIADLEEQIEAACAKHRKSVENHSEAVDLHFTSVEAANEAEEFVVVKQAELDSIKYRHRQAVEAVKGWEESGKKVRRGLKNIGKRLGKEKEALRAAEEVVEKLRKVVESVEAEERAKEEDLRKTEESRVNAVQDVKRCEDAVVQCEAALEAARADFSTKHRLISQTDALLHETVQDEETKLAALTALQSTLSETTIQFTAAQKSLATTHSTIQSHIYDLASLQEAYRNTLLDRYATNIAEAPLIETEIALGRQRQTLAEQEEEYRYIIKQHQKLKERGVNVRYQ